jgi:hypothetical protein
MLPEMVPTGATALDEEEQKQVPANLLPFCFTLGTMRRYEQGLGLPIKDWKLEKDNGELDIDALVDMLFCGLYDQAKGRPMFTKAQLHDMLTPRRAELAAIMVMRVIKMSSPVPTIHMLNKIQQLKESGSPLLTSP